MKISDQLINLCEQTDDGVSDDLRQRVIELEAENATLRHLEETVQRNMRCFEALLASTQDSIVLLTPRLTILKIVHSVLGRTGHDLVGQSVFSVIHPEDAPAMRAGLESLVLGERKSLQSTCRIVAKNEEWRWMEIEMTDLLDDPDIQAIVLYGRHIRNQ
jgi:PAS domain S-box-containing protein